MTQSKEIRWVRLGEFVIVCDEANKKNLDLPVMGLNKDKQMMPTVANLDGVNLSKYKLVDKGTFVFSGMQTGRDVCIRIVLASNDKPVLVSPAYTTFRVSETKKILAEYLFLWFDRTESDRFGWFISDSSVRSNLDWPRFLDIKIPVAYKDGEPDVERQQEVVDIWQGLRRLKEENEAITQPLLNLCQAKMDELKHSEPMVELGEYITLFEISNSNNEDLLVMGLNKEKQFMPTVANTDGIRLNKYKLIEKGVYAFSGMQTGRDLSIRIAYNGIDRRFLISPAYTTFKVKHEQLLPEFVYLWFKRRETDRLGWFYSDSSVRSNLDWSRFCSIKIPKPSIEVQRAIVDIYRCAREAKSIAEEATQQLKSICPALMQHIIHSSYES